MGNPEDLATFHVKTAVTVARLDARLGPDDDIFRSVVVNELAAQAPLPYDSCALLNELMQADNPMIALGEALAAAYSAAASQACSIIADEAVIQLFRCGGESAVQQFLADLEARADE